MSKNQMIITISNCLACIIVMVSVILVTNKNSVQAYQPPAPFLGPIYYGEKIILKVFDHRYPLFGEDFFDSTMHYDGSESNDDSGYYGYDQHLGVDYNLKYEPVLAAANGTVALAGWSVPSDHRKLYGLHAQIIHNANLNYRVWYGHLSVLTVKTGDAVYVDPANRIGIIGISGNTGSVLGDCPPVYENPICGAHLHIEVRINGKPVNPYGWIGTFPDPWSVYVQPTVTTMPGTPTPTPGTPTPAGATSYDLWLQYPARVANPAQYPDGHTIIEPTAPVAIRLIDDSDSEYSTLPSGCMAESNDGGINGSFDYTITTDTIGGGFGSACYAKWQITPNGYTTPGHYDVYVHIPGTLYPSTLSAEYQIYHNGQTHTAIVVQAAYPNSDHPDHWVYIGRHFFNMGGSGSEYILMRNITIADDSSHLIAADAVQFARVGGPAVTPTPTSTATVTPSPTPQMTIPVTQNSDDAGYNAALHPGVNPTPCSTTESRYSTTWNEVYLGHCPDGANVVSGFRFTNVAIPPGAVITKAQIEFTVDGPYSQTVNIQFRGELSANTSTFDNYIRPDNRPLTQATVLWNVPAADNWVVHQKRYSPNLKNIIQEIVNQSAWQSGNALTIIVQPQPGIPPNNHRRVFAIEQEGIVKAAKLQIWYTTPANTGFKSPSANFAESTGDGNGFEVNATLAYMDGGGYAVDNNSGTSTAASCTDITKDRHRYYNFSSFSIPSGATITGIEVLLDSKVDDTSGSPYMCVLLSRDGGSTWTAPKETPFLVTTEQSYILGGPTDKWGTLWIPGSFSSANFRVRIVNVASSTMRDFSLDWVAVNVYYFP